MQYPLLHLRRAFCSLPKLEQGNELHRTAVNQDEQQKQKAVDQRTFKTPPVFAAITHKADRPAPPDTALASMDLIKDKTGRTFS